MREKTAFIPVEEFNDSQLHSDFHFLEDVRRDIDIARRGKKGKGLLFGLLPHHLFKLQLVARLRKTDLQILPVAFSKRARNTTYLRYGDKKIFWRVEWEFPHVEFSCVDERVDEDEILGSCVDKYINEKSEHSNEKLSYYHSLKFSEIAILMKDGNSPSKMDQYHILELNKSLKSNFKYKKIIEYPTFLVISKLHMSCYETVP
ncbi:box C/D snoRNA protein 1 isoform X2 [Parasteatoda tepidariorum]|nr:box C/D snoRNA protein 1 isoform X2 [Parasteatoda tepidariorum]